MRLLRIFQLSFVGAALFSPTMADDAEKVHEEALRILREQTGGSTNNAPLSVANPGVSTTTARTNATSAAAAKAEREARAKAEVQQRLNDREKAQAEKRRQFEEYVKERERLRQQQRQYDDNLSKQPAPGKPTGVAPASADDVHEKALQILRETKPQASATAPATSAAIQPSLEPAGAGATSSSDAAQQQALETLRAKKAEADSTVHTAPKMRTQPVSEAEVAPRVTAATMAQAEPDRAAQEKALEILRQQMAAPSTAPAPSVAPAPAASPEPTPSPYLQQRLKEMQNELAAPQSKPTSAAAASEPAAVPDSYIKELEEKARRAAQENQSVVQPAAPTAPPAPAPAVTSSRSPAPSPASAPSTRGMDPKTREMIERQDRDIARRTGSATPTAAAVARPPYSRGLSPEAEAQARAILRQQQEMGGNASAASQPMSAPVSTASSTPASTQQPPINATASVSAATPQDNSQVQYSKELEERARQILMERAQTQQSATSPAAMPSSANVTASTQPASGTTFATPAGTASAAQAAAVASTTSGEPEQVHSKALETLNRIRPGEEPGGLPRTKQERLRDLTELYKADKITPSEYHQKRAAIIAEPNK